MENNRMLTPACVSAVDLGPLGVVIAKSADHNIVVPRFPRARGGNTEAAAQQEETGGGHYRARAAEERIRALERHRGGATQACAVSEHWRRVRGLCPCAGPRRGSGAAAHNSAGGQEIDGVGAGWQGEEEYARERCSPARAICRTRGADTGGSRSQQGCISREGGEEAGAYLLWGLQARFLGLQHTPASQLGA